MTRALDEMCPSEFGASRRVMSCRSSGAATDLAQEGGVGSVSGLDMLVRLTSRLELEQERKDLEQSEVGWTSSPGMRKVETDRQNAGETDPHGGQGSSSASEFDYVR